MKFTSAFIALVGTIVPHLTSAAPVRYVKRSQADITVMQFATFLEQLEANYYAAALQKFQESDFTSAGFKSPAAIIDLVKIIQQDESTHATVLENALKDFGSAPITGCKFNFDAGLTDVSTMAATARVVENLGVSAYLGGAQLIEDPIVLVDAASIATVEARHSSMLHFMSGTGSPVPTPFDLALKPQEVLAIASPFFDGQCDIGIPANPTLTITNKETPQPGTLLTFQSQALNGSVSEDSLFCQMMLPGQPTSIPLPMKQCIVPDGIDGPVYIWITSDGQPLLNNVRDRATTQLVAGPTLAYIDTKSQPLGQLIRSSSASSGGGSSSSSSSSSSSDSSNSGNNSGSSNSGSDGSAVTSTTTSTATLSPPEASSLINSASATDAAPAAQPTTNGAASNPAANMTPGQPNMFEGPSPDGKVTVNGWSNINSN